jgi:hypothetical protein
MGSSCSSRPLWTVRLDVLEPASIEPGAWAQDRNTMVVPVDGEDLDRPR